MTVELRRALECESEKILDIYLEAFPKEERKPFSMILEHNKIGKAELLAVTDDGELAGMAFVYKFNGFAMVDYLAVSKDKRGVGIGSCALELIKKRYEGYKIFLEIEDPNAGEMQARRLEFYKRCGLRETGTKVNLFSVDMDLLSFGDFQISFDEYFELYINIAGNEFATRFVKQR